MRRHAVEQPWRSAFRAIREKALRAWRRACHALAPHFEDAARDRYVMCRTAKPALWAVAAHPASGAPGRGAGLRAPAGMATLHPMSAAQQVQPRHQRARGGADLEFRLTGGRTRIAHLHQAAPSRFLFPTPEPGEPPLAALVNTAGGLAGGDAVSVGLRLGAGCHAILSTPSAEKVYRSLGPATRVAAEIGVGPGATLEWLPQETILFDGARLDRGFAVRLDPGARLLMAEMVVFGRQARGETMRQGALLDRWRMVREGRLLWAEGVALGDDLAERRAARFGFAGAEAMATLLLVRPGVVEPCRDALRAAGVAATIARPGLLVARWLGDAVAVRDGLAAAICGMRAEGLGLAPRLPRLWTS
jgi:urease accessory protein